MTISPRFQATGRKPYNFGLSRLPLGGARQTQGSRDDPRRHRKLHQVQVHRLRRCLPRRLLPRGAEHAGDRPGRMHRLRGVHPRMPGQRDYARRRPVRGAEAVHSAERRARQDLDQFLADLFGIQAELRTLASRHHELAPLYSVKRQFVQRRAANKVKPEEAAKLDGPALEAELKKNHLDWRFDELTFAKKVTHWLADEAGHAVPLDLALKYSAWALHTPAGRARVQAGVLFKAPSKIDPRNLLVHAQKSDRDGVVTYTIRPEHIRRRKGVVLTDPGTDLVGALD